MKPYPPDHRSWYGSDGMLDYFSTTYRRAQKALTGFQEEVLSLLTLGLLALSYRETYDSYYDVFIPPEAMPLLSERFFTEMDKKRKQLEQDMYAESPDPIISYSGRIFDDMIKVQAAIVCGLLEQLKSKEGFKKRSISSIAHLLKVEDSYVERLIVLFERLSYKNRLHVSVGKIEYNVYDLLRKAVTGSEINTAVLSILLTLKRWIRTEHFIKYLLNHRGMYRWRAALTIKRLKDILDDLVLLGMIDSSRGRGILRVSHMAERVLNNEKMSAISVLKAESRPLVIQNNLEFLLPFNAEMDVIRSVSEFSELTVLDRMLHFSITKNSMINALDKGWTAVKITEYLTSVSSTPIPQAVRHFINTMDEKKGEAVIMPCTALIKCTGLGLKKKIMDMKGIDAFGPEGLDDYLCIRNKEADDILAFLKKKGVFADMADAFSENGSHPAIDLNNRLTHYKQDKKEVVLVCRRSRKRFRIKPCRINSVRDGKIYFIKQDGYMDTIHLKYLEDILEV